MLCSREVLPPGLRSRWPASEKLASAMAGAQPGRCMGGRGRLEGAARALGSAACFGERKEVRSRFPVRTSNPRGSDPRSSSKGDAGSGCERWIWARSPPAAAWVPVGVGSSDSPEQGLRVLKPESRLSPAPPLWPRTQPHPLYPSARSWAGLSLVQPQGPLPATPGSGRTANIPPPTLDPLQTLQTHRGPAVGRLTGLGIRVRGPRPLVLPQLGCRLLSHLPPRTCLPLWVHLPLHVPPPQTHSSACFVRRAKRPGDPWDGFLAPRRWKSVYASSEFEFSPLSFFFF